MTLLRCRKTTCSTILAGLLIFWRSFLMIKLRCTKKYYMLLEFLVDQREIMKNPPRIWRTLLPPLLEDHFVYQSFSISKFLEYSETHARKLLNKIISHGKSLNKLWFFSYNSFEIHAHIFKFLEHFGFHKARNARECTLLRHFCFVARYDQDSIWTQSLVRYWLFAT